MPSFTVPGAGITPFEAAKKMRFLIRSRHDMGRIVLPVTQPNEPPPASFSRFDTYTDEAIVKILESTKSKKVQGAVESLQNRLRDERTRKTLRYQEKKSVIGGETYLTWDELVNLYELIQHIPTAQALPSANKPETALRAIHAVLKNSGVTFDDIAVQAQNDEAPDEEEDDGEG